MVDAAISYSPNGLCLCSSVFQNQNGIFISLSNRLDCCVLVVVISNETGFFRSLNVKFLFSSLFIL
jgi:hypothetical protein